MDQGDRANPRDLKRFVRESARRRREQEERAKRQSRESSIGDAAEKKEELDKVLSRRRRDYSGILGAIAVLALVAGGGFGAYRAWQGYRQARRPAWTRPEFSPEDLLAAEEHARKVILKAERSRLTFLLAAPDTPPYWREKAQRILKELAQGKGVIGEVFADDRHLGSAPRFIVECKGDAGSAMILLEKTPDGLRLVNANKAW